MTGPQTITFQDDLRWNEERDCVEVTAVVREGDRVVRLPCAISREALEAQVRTPGRIDPLRLFRDFEGRLEAAVARKAAGHPPEVALTRRDLKP